MFVTTAVARRLIGGCLFIYSCSARLVSFQIDLNLISKETSRAEHEYMNKHPLPPPINALATAVFVTSLNEHGLSAAVS